MKTVIIRDMNQYMMEMNKIVRQLGQVGSDICNRGAHQSKQWIKNYLRMNRVVHEGTLITSIKSGHKYLSSTVYIERPADEYAPQIDSKAGLLPGGVWIIFDSVKFEKAKKRYPKIDGATYQFAKNSATLFQWVSSKNGLSSDLREFFISVGAVRVGAGHVGIYAQHPLGLHFMEGGFKFSTDPKKLMTSYYKSLQQYGLA